MLDLTNYYDYNKSKEYKVYTYYINLSRALILEALSNEKIYINGKFFEVPETQFLECLLNKNFGLQKVELIEITNN